MNSRRKSYAQELRERGAESSSRNKRAPFIRWPEKGDDGEAYVEGTLMELWTGEHGDVARVLVDKAAPGMEAGTGKDEDLKVYPVEVGMVVNIGLKLASLKGTVSDDRVGDVVCISFEGWGTTKRTKEPFRKFDVLWPKDPPTADELEEGNLEIPFDDE